MNVRISNCPLLPDVGKYLLPLICFTFELNEAVGGVGPFCTTVINTFAVSPANKLVILNNVLAVTAQVKKFAALKSNEPVNPAVPAVSDADITLPCAEPVTTNEPDIIAEPVNGNDAPPPPAFNANDAVIANDDVVANDALAILPNKNEAVDAKLALVANDADATNGVLPLIT